MQDWSELTLLMEVRRCAPPPGAKNDVGRGNSKDISLDVSRQRRWKGHTCGITAMAGSPKMESKFTACSEERNERSTRQEDKFQHAKIKKKVPTYLRHAAAIAGTPKIQSKYVAAGAKRRVDEEKN